MASSGLLTDYMGSGTLAARPATPNIPATGLAWYAVTSGANVGNVYYYNTVTPAWVLFSGGGGGGVGSHEYWRIRSMSFPNGDYNSWGGVQFRTTIGGGQAATGGTAVTSLPIQAGNMAQVLTDTGGTHIIQFDKDTSKPVWIGYQWPAPVSIAEIAVYCYQGIPSRCPREWAVDYSDDGLAWVQVCVHYHQTFVDNTQVIRPVPV
jgi:hypothetical protein